MNYNIKTYHLFDREAKRLAKRYKSLKQDITELAKKLLENPETGIDLGHGIHKVRMPIKSKGKGKSGGARVITVIIALSQTEKQIGLHFIYDKSERENISNQELQEVLKQNGL